MGMMHETRKTLKFILSLEAWRMAVLWTFFLLISHLQFLAPSLFSRKPKSYPRCSSATIPTITKHLCVITGATSGLGAAAANALAREGFLVVLVGRSSKLLSKTIMEIKQHNESAQLKAFEADLSSFKSILKFKSSLEKWLLESNMHSSICLLINNAGILATSSRLTPDGYDQMMATNYMGAFSLTRVLLPLLQNSPVPSRIVNVTSFTHRSVFDVQVDKETMVGKHLSLLEFYPYAHIYEYSKMCMLLFSYELHRRCWLLDESRPVSVIAVDPGAVETNIMREIPSCIAHLAYAVLRCLRLLQSPERGVSSIIDAALAPPEVSGVYFFGGKGRTITSSPLSSDINLAEELWATSCALFSEMWLRYREE